MTKYAVFRHGHQITAGYETKISAAAVALAKGYVIHTAADFPGDKTSYTLADGYEIREATDD